MDSERWSAALWPFVRSRLPSVPARVIELGCGPAGGFVPALRERGYEAVGVDPDAPAGPGYERIAFEQFRPRQPVDAIVASRSLHHVGDLGDVIARAAGALRPGGVVIVAEWAWEHFDEDTAHWCFARLEDSGTGDPDWLHRRRDGWLESGQAWAGYFAGWTTQHGLHRGDRILRELDARFERALCSQGPYFFADLAGTAEQAEQAAIDAGDIRATGIRYVASLR